MEQMAVYVSPTTPRPAMDEYFTIGAEWASMRGTCLRRRVGCILINKRGHILGTGYNGVAAGLPHCNEPIIIEGKTAFIHGCEGSSMPSGMGLDNCEAIHAEQNALLQCRDEYDIWTCYVTHSPCITCVKLLLNTSCERIVFRHRYAHDEASKTLWQAKHPAGWISNGYRA